MAEIDTNYDTSLEFWRVPKVAEKTGLSVRTIWKWVNEGKFPEARRIGATAVAWRSTDVLAWMNSRPVATIENGLGGIGA